MQCFQATNEETENERMNERERKAQEADNERESLSEINAWTFDHNGDYYYSFKQGE